MLPTIHVHNLGAAGAVPFTAGQVFKPGAVKPGDPLGATFNGAPVALQLDWKAKHADGSLRHGILSGVVEGMAAGEVRALHLVNVAPPATSAAVAKKGFDLARAAKVEIVVDGVEYTAVPDPTNNMLVWMQGPIVDEWHVAAAFYAPDGKPHPHLTAIFAARLYAAMPDNPRIEITIENCKTFAAGARWFDYGVRMHVGGALVYERPAMRHYHHARWRRVFWTGQAAGRVTHDTNYLIESRAVPHYDQTQKPGEKELAAIAARLAPAMQVPMSIGPLNPAMGTTGGRPDIGPLPMWYVAYLLTMDKRAQDMMTCAAEGSGSWSIHYRDENTGYPVRLDNPVNSKISTHMNLANRGPLPVPRYANNDRSMFATPYSHDSAHEPSLAYLPYLLTGEYFYLEELHFWAAWNPTETDPANHGNGLGLLNWQQVRGQAWSMRTLGHAAYITPDAHPLKAYFAKQLDVNLDFYHQTYVVGNPNALGAYDGSGKGSFPWKGSAPWQDDFFTWSFGHLTELGFDKARPILEWKAKYPVGRMTAPGFCWTQAAAYYLDYKPTLEAPVVGSFGELYKLNFDKPTIRVESRDYTHPQGLRYIDQPCGSQAQADWLNAAGGQRHWKPLRMTGFADSVEGFPSNMQPALAAAADAGVPGAREAWEKYEKRVDKPNYRTGPQFNIVPRPVPVVVPEPKPDPVPTTPPPVGFNERVLMEMAIHKYCGMTDADAVKQRPLVLEVFGLLLDSERARTMTKR